MRLNSIELSSYFILTTRNFIISLRSLSQSSSSSRNNMLIFSRSVSIYICALYNYAVAIHISVSLCIAKILANSHKCKFKYTSRLLALLLLIFRFNGLNCGEIWNSIKMTATRLIEQFIDIIMCICDSYKINNFSITRQNGGEVRKSWHSWVHFLQHCRP